VIAVYFGIQIAMADPDWAGVITGVITAEIVVLNVKLLMDFVIG
jgi:hypothetical protein